MQEYKLVSDYRDNDRLRESFNRLAQETFQLDFDPWFAHGYWTDKYIPFSFINEEGEVIANASIYKMTIEMNQVTHQAIQIGTVMTDKRYRNQGLAKKLMDHILELYQDSVDFIYLFANQSVLDFYPKFGFTRADECEYSVSFKNSQIKAGDKELIKLSVDHDLKLLESFAKNRCIRNSAIAVKDNPELLMFYFLIAFPDSIYYLKDLETIVLMELEEEVLHIFDVISLKEQDVREVVSRAAGKTTERIVFHFEPGVIDGLSVQKRKNDEDELFYLSQDSLFEGEFKFPLTSHS
ncbi:GNAT family N-acetyltransferase [Jeotgalibacillus sp. ET6]|uniref:GNAT family N-acetyltransferase n=1 Tax=Jeotgalibacillus sp. ET6 TaxID=3037260 RepID=UPI00241873D0|nr:GNAT family N-acetyltransferase [Jeotgalibacillus sp. ET6]MDG5472080.1 GNAT family N-acetyltransferase [Jeotgalibacillus sp. ET6]